MIETSTRNICISKISVHINNNTSDGWGQLKIKWIDYIEFFPKKSFTQVSKMFVINNSKVFAVKYPEVIIADKMSVITIEEDYKESLKGIDSELGEIVDD